MEVYLIEYATNIDGDTLHGFEVRTLLEYGFFETKEEAMECCKTLADETRKDIEEHRPSWNSRRCVITKDDNNDSYTVEEINDKMHYAEFTVIYNVVTVKKHG